ncbi:MAG: hypothetical protein R3293_21875 [Candidatus Promineifilaceae bacterium]|nr:hypothetical protein [Candidatus Promineifilaceae bacterium]
MGRWITIDPPPSSILMTTPLDHEAHNRTGIIRLARLFSNIVSPPVIFAILGLILTLYSLPSVQALGWAALNGFINSLLPILFVLWLLRTGRVAELHMSNTAERHLPYIIAVLCGLLTLGIVIVFDGPPLLQCLALFEIVALSALGIINTQWLISFHATAISAAWAIIALTFGWQASLLVLPLVIAVVVVRLFLKRHTPAQVIAGLFLGTVSVWLLTYIGCFV